MRHRHPILLLPLALAVACGGPPPPSPPPPPVLAYAPDDTVRVLYRQGDTTRVDIDAAGQSVQMDVASSASLATTFAPPATGPLTVTVEIRDFSARATNPLGAPRVASPEDVSGALVFTLDRRGHAVVESRPDVRGVAADFVSAESLAATLFPLLPGGPVTAGATWEDTVRVVTEGPSGTVTSTAALTFTVAGDTVVAGAPLLLVRVRGRDERVIEGSQGGIDIVQNLQGESQGHFLWDTARELVVESVYGSELRGSMDVSLSTVPLSVRVRSRTTTRLEDPPPPAR